MKITDIKGPNGFTFTLDDNRVFNAIPVFNKVTQQVTYPGIPADVAALLNGVISNSTFLEVFNGLYPGVVGSGGSGSGKSSVTLVVSPIPGQGDFTTIQAAVDALPTQGGRIALSNGSYDLTTTVLIPDKSIIFIGCGNATIVNLGSHAIAGFTINPIMTLGRKITFLDFVMQGGSVPGQTMFAYQDGNSNSWFQATRVHVNNSSIETIVDIQNYDQTQTRVLKIQLNECAIFPTALATSTLVKCVNPAGNQSGQVVVAWNNCILRDLQDLGIFDRFWNINAAVDISLSYTSTAFSTPSAVNGFHASDSDFFILGGGDLTIFGATAFLPDAILDTLVFGLDFGSGLPSRIIYKAVFSGMSFVGSIFSIVVVRIETGVDSIFFTSCIFPGAAIVDTAIDIEDRPFTRITGCEFGDPFGAQVTQAILLNNALSTTITGCGFNESGATKTIVETGTTDKTMVAGCVGISNGAGFVKIGANSLIAAGTVNIA